MKSTFLTDSAFNWIFVGGYWGQSNQNCIANMALTQDQIKIIKATVQVLQEHGNTITTVFYKNMLTENPELNAVFNTANQLTGHQQQALAGALYAYASYIDDLGVLAPAVELIVHKHASLYIRPEHYSIVGTYLLAAMKDVLGNALTPDILEAWTAAYWQLANLLISKEESLYKEADGWTDWRDFTIASKIRESDEITSFYLKPIDGRPLPTFRPGQYISVRVDVPGLKYSQARQYSLSDKHAPDCYRISVKREQGLDPKMPTAKAHPGYVSNIMHDVKKDGDVIKVSHPSGDFFLTDSDAANSSTPIVLISGGVGLTPLTSILNTVASDPSQLNRRIHFIHSARQARTRAFKDHVLSLQKERPTLQVTFFNSSPSADEKPGEDFHHRGQIDLKRLDANSQLFLDDASTQYYLCGPEAFMLAMALSLGDLNVPADGVHMELFGTGGVPKI